MASRVIVEALLLGPSAVIGEIEALLDESVDIDRPMLSRTLARVQQHVLDDGVCALAMLNDLVEIVAQGIGQLGYLSDASYRRALRPYESSLAVRRSVRQRHPRNC